MVDIPKVEADALSMQSYRVATFRAAVITRLAQGAARGVAPEVVARTLAAEQHALAKALCSPDVIAAAGDALIHAEHSLTTNPRYVGGRDIAREAMRQILSRRAAEAQECAEQVIQPSYYTPLVGQMPVAEIVPSLQAVKYAETLEELLHRDAQGAPQVIAHIEALAKGTMLEHDALAKTFAPDGLLAAALRQALQAELSQVPEAQISQLATDWLQLRQQTAQLSADLCTVDGAAYKEAVAQSTAWHAQPQPAHTAGLVNTGAKLSPRAKELERQKSAVERGEDIAYTINHAIACGTTDIFVQPAASVLAVSLVAEGIFPKWMGWVTHIFEGHDHHDHQDHPPHDHHHNHSHDHHARVKGKWSRVWANIKENFRWKNLSHNMLHWTTGEVAGDVGGILPTIVVQRFFPGFMDGLRNLLEPISGKAFRGGAERDARRWGEKQGLAADAPQVIEKANELYDYEMRHLPQAVMWNAFSIPINFMTQWAMSKPWHPSPDPSRRFTLGKFLIGKTFGTLFSNGVLLGGRAIAPKTAHAWDQWNSEHLITPATEFVSGFFGEKPLQIVAGQGKIIEARVQYDAPPAHGAPAP